MTHEETVQILENHIKALEAQLAYWKLSFKKQCEASEKRK